MCAAAISKGEYYIFETDIGGDVAKQHWLEAFDILTCSSAYIKYKNTEKKTIRTYDIKCNECHRI